MYNTKILPVVALAGASLAQTFLDPGCAATETSFIAGAPTIPAVLSPYMGIINGGVQTISGVTTSLPPDTLMDPEGYVKALCQVAGELPSSALPEFQSWGQELLSYGSAHLSDYDAFITKCITTGEAAATLTSYLNSILTGTGPLCRPTAAPGGAPNATITSSAPTVTATSSGSGNFSTTPVLAAAARPTGMLVGAAAIGGLLGAAALL
ncbi:hypothetical protein F5Y19DRAFT_487245 [Xylariaceae sp. FL1651]|nr:hypothetical protein F5Y19DRAFT_487245 [Xylariaceae sp. FL1651]